MKISPIVIVPLLSSLLFFAGCDQKNNSKHQVKKGTSTKVNSQSGLPVNDNPLCDMHKVQINVCFICNPSLRDAKRLYCDEHGLYEDECFFCHPEITKG